MIIIACFTSQIPPLSCSLSTNVVLFKIQMLYFNQCCGTGTGTGTVGTVTFD
jgi:hypothetical protein